jgi:hypothetical protein
VPLLAVAAVLALPGMARAAGLGPVFTSLPAAGSSELQSARERAIAAPLRNGDVLIAGGFDGNNYLQSAELFDPTTNTFTALPATGNTQLQTPRYGALAATLPNGDALIAGGFDGNNYLQAPNCSTPPPTPSPPYRRPATHNSKPPATARSRQHCPTATH